MKQARVKVAWDRRFPMRATIQMVQLARRFRSRILFRAGAQLADAQSILGILILASSLVSYVDVEVSGDDEQEAVQAMVEHFDRHQPPGQSA